MQYKWVLSRFFAKLSSLYGYVKYFWNIIKELSFIIRYQPLKGRGLLFNLIFSLTIAGIITSIDVFLKNYEVAFVEMIFEFLVNSFLVFIGLVVLGYPIIILLKYVNSRFPWSTAWLKRTLIDVLLILLIAIVSAFIFSLIAKGNQGLSADWSAGFAKFFTFSFIACMTFILLVEAIVFFNERQMYLNKSEQLLRENLQTKFEVLKNQINPHFLFNNLNVLSSLVYQDPKVADRFIIEFSKIYRYILDMQAKAMVSLESELNFLDSYTYLLKQRFKDGITVKKEISSSLLQKKIPPLTLQLLMENVVKHNIISMEHPLTVYLKEEDDRLIFKNKITLRNQSEKLSGLGFNNIQERYKLVSSRSVTIQKEDGFFLVSLPLLDMEEDD
jgi:two-component system LytT family sensor kinase